MVPDYAILIALITAALLFDFMNGMNDAANSIATIVSTRVLSPRYAVFWAAFFNFIAFVVFGQAVAKTMGSGIVDTKIITDQVIFGALSGAISWQLITWAAGIPSSSTHAMVGGLVGMLVGVLVGVWVGVGIRVGVLVAVGSGVFVGGGVLVGSKNAFCVESAWIVCTSAVAVCPLSGVAVAVTPKVNKPQALDSVAASSKNKIMTR